MSEIDAVLYEYVKSIHVIYMDFFCFQASTALCIFMSTHANSWIKVAARQNIIWIRFGNRRAVRRWRAEAGMALTAIGEFAQWGGVADCSGSRTKPLKKLYVFFLLSCFPWSSYIYFHQKEQNHQASRMASRIHLYKKENSETLFLDILKA